MPFLLISILHNEGMLDMLTKDEAWLAEDHILTHNALIDRLIVFNFLELAAVTIIEELFANFPIVFGFNMFILFLFEFTKIFIWFSIPAERTFDHTFLRVLMLGPLSKAFKMKNVIAFSLAGGDSIMLGYFHHADSTYILIFIIFFVFLHDDSLGNSFLDALEKISNFVGVNDPISYDVSQLLICIFILQ